MSQFEYTRTAAQVYKLLREKRLLKYTYNNIRQGCK